MNFEVTVCRKDSLSEKSALPSLHFLCHDFALEELIYPPLPCHLVGQIILKRSRFALFSGPLRSRKKVHYVLQ